MRKKREESFITIKDVAKEADVSIATVSRVLNEGKVSEKRKRAVLDAIQKLNYVPNNSARNLASVNNTKRIALVVPTLEVQNYIELIKGFKTGSKLYKYDPIIEEYSYDVLEYELINERFDRSSEIKGIIQFAPREELNNKVVIDIYDELLDFHVSDKFKDKGIGIYFGKDDYLANFFSDVIFKDNNTNILDASEIATDDNDVYITQTIEQAAKLINNGVKAPIYTLNHTDELSQIIGQINTFNIDFYSMGVGLSRIIIKRLTGRVTDEDQPLVINVGE